MSWIIGGIELPTPPASITDTSPAEIKSSPYPAELPVLISLGKKARVLILEGLLHSSGKSAEQLETEYIIPLRDKVHTVVAVSSPGTRYDGNYILEGFSCEERAAHIDSFNYKLELWQGELMIVKGILYGPT